MIGPSQKNVKILLTSILIDLFGFTAIIPLFPSILAYYENYDNSPFFQGIYKNVVNFRSQILNAPELLNSHNNNDLILNSISLDSILLGGFLGSWFSLLQCLSNPIYTKKFKSSKKAIIISLSGSFFSSCIWYYSDTFKMFLLARTLGGLFEGNVSISLTVLGQIGEDARKRKAMAFVGICYSLAFIFGPLIGVRLGKNLQFLELFGFTDLEFYKMPAVFSGTCCFIALLVVVIFYEDEEIIKSSKTGSLNSSLDSKFFYFIYFIYLIGFSGVEFTLGFLFLQKFNLNRSTQGRIYASLGFLMALIQGSIVRKKAGHNLAKNSLILLIISFILLTFENFKFVILGLILKAIAAAAMVPSFNFIASKNPKFYNLAELRSFGALARAIGPILFCSVYWIMGSRICFMSGSFLMVVSFLMLRKLHDSVDETSKKDQ